MGKNSVGASVLCLRFFLCQCRLQMEKEENEEEGGFHNTARCREQAEATADSSR